jgi:hypothetical protein
MNYGQVKINHPKFRFIKSLRHTAILIFRANLDWCVKRQNIAGLSQQTFFSVQLIFFLDHVLLLAELAQKFKFFKNSCMMK